MNTPEQKSNIAKTAIFMLKDENFEFNMRHYCSANNTLALNINPVIHVCGTSCCLAGYGPIALGNGGGQTWDKYISEFFGKDNIVWSFLFDPNWPSDRLEAAARVIYFFNNEKSVREWSEQEIEHFEMRFWTDESVEELIEELEKYIIP